MHRIIKSFFIISFLLAPFYKVHAGNVTYIYSDIQGTPLAEADSNGNILASYDYRPYGVQSLGSLASGPGFTGHVNDPDTGLVYMQARYYDASIGRFLSTDPLGTPPGGIFSVNSYDYTSNNPVMRIDPDGRSDDESPCSSGCRAMRKLSDYASGIRDGLQGALQQSGGRGPGSEMAVMNAYITAGAYDDISSASSAAAPAAGAVPGADAIGCTMGGCTGFQWGMAVIGVIPVEGVELEGLGIAANEIRQINRAFGGITELTGSAETVIANMSYREGLPAKAATAIRDIAGRHLFDDANKRTAQAVAEKLLGPGADASKIRSVIDRVSTGNLRDVEDITNALGQ